MSGEVQVDWNQISCAEREALVDEIGRSCNGFSEESGVGVLTGRTDLGGFPPIVLTVWGYRETEVPLLKDVRHPARYDFPGDEGQPDLKPCEHFKATEVVEGIPTHDLDYDANLGRVSYP